MIAANAKFHDWVARCQAWEPNPIVVKELRQAVRSRVLLGMFYFLVFLFFTMSLFILLQESISADTSYRTGRELCMACLGGLVIGCLIFIPLYTGFRVTWEQREADLTLFTPMRASEVVKGKVMTGLYVVILFFSAAAPFMMLGNFLRGIDWLTIQFTLFVLLYAASLAILAAMAVAVLPMPAIIKSILGIGLIFALLIFSLFVFGFLSYAIEVGAWAIIPNADFLAGVIIASVFSIFPMIICYGLSVSFLVPHHWPAVRSGGET